MIGTDEAAQQLQVTRRTIARVAKDHQIGKLVSGIYVFTASDLKQLRKKVHGKVGKPPKK